MNIDLSACYNESILLIGPMCAGKTTICESLYKVYEVKRRLNLLKTDILFRSYLNEKKFFARRSKNSDERIREKEDLAFVQKLNYKFIFSILSSLTEPTLIDFGGNSTLIFDEKDKENLKNMFLKFKNVVLLLPVKDKDESLNILQKRWEKSERKNCPFAYDINKDILYDLFNEEIATIIVYTEGRSIDDIVYEILKRVKENKYSYRKKGGK